ncbi:MAG: energy-coupling factor ABC transporter permease [Ilumatobacteraceae bacterium]
MHIPDGFIDGPTSLGAGVVAATGVGVCLRRCNATLDDRQVPLIGLTASFVFAAQMLNFPVAAGTSGHLLGGVLAAVLVGPWAAPSPWRWCWSSRGCCSPTACSPPWSQRREHGPRGALAGYAIFAASEPSSRDTRRGGGVGRCGRRPRFHARRWPSSPSTRRWQRGREPRSWDGVDDRRAPPHRYRRRADHGDDGVGGARDPARPGGRSARPVAARRGHGRSIGGGIVSADARRRRPAWLIGGFAVVVTVMVFVLAPNASSSPDGLEKVAADTGVDAEVRDHASPTGRWPTTPCRAWTTPPSARASPARSGWWSRWSSPSRSGGSSPVAGLGRRSTRRDRRRPRRERCRCRQVACGASDRGDVRVRGCGRRDTARPVLGVRRAGCDPGGRRGRAPIPARTWWARLALELPFVALALAMPFVGQQPFVHLGGVRLSEAGLWGLDDRGQGHPRGGRLRGARGHGAERALIAGLERLRLPRLVTGTMAFMVRYGDVLADEHRRMRIARLARGDDPRWLWQAGTTARTLGALFVRSDERANACTSRWCRAGRGDDAPASARPR